jgi:hypothetical protein
MTPPVTPITPSRPPVWEPLETALRHRRPLRLTYHSRQRHISPHALGWKDGRPMLLGYQTTTTTTHTTPAPHTHSPGWRCMYIDEIEDIATPDHTSTWATADNYNPTRPFPAIDHVTIAITTNDPNHPS